MVILAGCMTQPKTDAKNAADDEYVTLPPKTGSNLPRRVKKSDLLAGKVPDADTSSVGTVSQDDFKNSIGHPVRAGN
jgi:hypothetical protein